MSVSGAVKPRLSVSNCALPFFRSRARRWQLAAAAFCPSCKHAVQPISHPQLRLSSRASSRSVVTRAWGAPVDWSEARVESSEEVGERMHRLIIDVGEEIGKGYKVGGQYVQVKVEDSKPAYLAIASPPSADNAGALEFLIKSVPGATAELLCQLKEGDKALVGPIEGKGFAVDRIPADTFETVLIFATGTGISPIKALLESGALDVAARKDVRLYYGATNNEMMCYKEQIPEWEAMGVRVIKVFSADGKGYVQDVFQTDIPVADGTKTGVLLCGQKEMSEAVKLAVSAIGVPSECCLGNY